MKRINVGKMVDPISIGILLINIVLTALIAFVENNPIIAVYKMIFLGVLGINSIILLLISVLMKRKIVLINILAVVLIFFAARFNKPSLSEDDIWAYRNEVVQDIESGNYEVNDGVINLPDEDIYEKVSDTKRVILALDGDRAVMYFYENAGVLEDSCGYIYYSDKLDKSICIDSYEFINKEHVAGNWYFCSTR